MVIFVMVLNQPELDDFVLQSTVHTIKTKKPNLLLVHFTDLDTQRHYHGFSSDEAIAAIHRHNERLGKILEALKESGIYENSTVVVLGDHSALDENKAVNLNVLLHKKAYYHQCQREDNIIGRLIVKVVMALHIFILKTEHDLATITK